MQFLHDNVSYLVLQAELKWRYLTLAFDLDRYYIKFELCCLLVAVGRVFPATLRLISFVMADVLRMSH